MAFCLPPEFANRLIAAFKDGTITPERLTSMTSSQRREFLSDIVGADDAKQVNAMFEKTLLLKNQKQGMVTWAKNITGIKEPARRDIISRVQRMENVLEADDLDNFLEDLASAKLGTDVSFEEAKTITELSRKVSQLEEGIESEPFGSAKRLELGATKVALKNYVDELKLTNNKTTLSNFKERLATNPGRLLKDFIVDTAGFAKSVVASVDNSLWFRQGLKALVLKPKIWGKNFAQSWVDIAKQLSRKPNDTRIVDAVLAEIWSRPNATSGIYQKAGLDVGIIEEAYPSSLPTRIPLLGRVFKASETAYTGGSYRLRADIFDEYYKTFQKTGVDVNDKKFLEDLGKLVNSLTGRGHLGKAEAVAKEANVLLFSPRHLKSQFDFLTAHSFSDMTPALKVEAAKNLAKVGAAVTSVLAIAHSIDPDLVETDPRSSNFGKIIVGNTRFDIMAGLASMITATSRVVRQSSKSSTSGRITELNTGEYGGTTGQDVVVNFFSNKLSPAAQAVNTAFLKGETFSGEEPTVTTTLEQLLVPIIIQNIDELQNTPGAANVWVASLLDAIGIGSTTY